MADGADPNPPDVPIDSLICPHCRRAGCLNVSVITVNGRRRLVFHCPRCREVWAERGGVNDSSSPPSDSD
jgi:hypothetical protein